MSWLNDSLNNIKGQISNFASGVLAEGIGNEEDPSIDNTNNGDLRNLIANQNHQIELLQRQNAELHEKMRSHRVTNENEAGNDDGWSWDTPPESKENTGKIITDLKRKIEGLENERQELLNSLEQLDLDCQQTTDKLVTIKDELQNENVKLKGDQADLIKKNEFLMKINEENQKKIANLELVNGGEQLDEIKRLNVKIEELLEVKKYYEELKMKHADMILPEDYNKLEYILQEYESKVNSCEKEIKSLKIINSELKNSMEEIELVKNENKMLTIEMEELKKNYLEIQKLESMKIKLTESEATIKELNMNTDKLHKKYVDILRESITKCTDTTLPTTTNNTSQLSEYTNIVEAILKLIMDYKWKCETLDKELLNLSEEKTKMSTEKNFEIEKLLKNSEDLSQEVILKSQELKHYEGECNELIKNNELLITRLDEMKNASGSLQTISEKDEDNVLHLESQLEKSNKRIEELELIIADMEGQDASIETETELAYIKNQLNLTGKELDDTKKQYQTLSNKYKLLESDNSNLKNNLQNMRVDLTECCSQKDDLNTTVDQIKTEYENTEYKFTEQNINMETLKEEIETHLQTIEELTRENQKYELLKLDLDGKNELMQKEIDDLKQELTLELETRDQRNLQMQSLEEKLQLSKMAETSLKLQYDKLNNEHLILNDFKENLQCNFENVNSQLISYKDQIDELTRIKEEYLDNENNLQNSIFTLKETISSLQSNKADNIQEIISEKNQLSEKLQSLQDELKEKELLVATLTNVKIDLDQLKIQYEAVISEKNNLQADFDHFKSSVAENNCPEDTNKLSAQIEELSNSRAQLIQLIQEKHQENINYHSEIQRLHQINAAEIEKCCKLEEQYKTSLSASEVLKNEEVEKLNDQNNFLREKCSVLAENLMQEQSNTQKVLAERSTASERELTLQKKLDKLTQHLIEIEDMYTKEVQQAEQKCEGMQKKVNEIEQREKNSSNRYTSVNIRANQQVETLQTQLQLVTNQRDELKKKLSDYEDQVGKQNAALTNLQIVLQQFQREKDSDVQNETERVRRQISIEKAIQDGLQKEINDLKAQLVEGQVALRAAVRLSDQVEHSKKQVVLMKEEVSKLTQELTRSQEKCNKLMNQTDGKVDKMLIKNLIIGLVATNNNLTKDQNQILKIISTVLDFNQQDIEKVQLNKTQNNSWFNSLLHPSIAGQNMTQESLSQAFVKFLEAESKPRELPNLLETASAVKQDGDGSNRSSVRQSPIILNEVFLPTFADFGQNRNSSSILKDVLKDNTNS